jgi:hypothetical protein
MVRPLSMKERNEIIGLALDIDADFYNERLDTDWGFTGSNLDKKIGAAIYTVYQATEEDMRLENNDTFVSIWGRVIMYTTKHGGNSILKIFPSRKKAQAEVSSLERINDKD